MLVKTLLEELDTKTIAGHCALLDFLAETVAANTSLDQDSKQVTLAMAYILKGIQAAINSLSDKGIDAGFSMDDKYLLSSGDLSSFELMDCTRILHTLFTSVHDAFPDKNPEALLTMGVLLEAIEDCKTGSIVSNINLN